MAIAALVQEGTASREHKAFGTLKFADTSYCRRS
jgi:hypothetical protein